MSLSWMGLKRSLSFSPLKTPWPQETLCIYHPGQRASVFSFERREGAVNSLRQDNLLSILYKCLTSLTLTLIRGLVQHCPLIAPFCYLSLENMSSQHKAESSMDPFFTKAFFEPFLLESTSSCLLGPSILVVPKCQG